MQQNLISMPLEDVGHRNEVRTPAGLLGGRENFQFSAIERALTPRASNRYR